jgi:hypothetical protein
VDSIWLQDVMQFGPWSIQQGWTWSVLKRQNCVTWTEELCCLCSEQILTTILFFSFGLGPVQVSVSLGGHDLEHWLLAGLTLYSPVLSLVAQHGVWAAR